MPNHKAHTANSYGRPDSRPKPADQFENRPQPPPSTSGNSLNWNNLKPVSLGGADFNQTNQSQAIQPPSQGHK